MSGRCVICNLRRRMRGAVVCLACYFQDHPPARPLHVSGKLPRARRCLMLPPYPANASRSSGPSSRPTGRYVGAKRAERRKKR